jgi:3',5'-cyclic AMP phosphodiesterase CpdA
LHTRAILDRVTTAARRESADVYAVTGDLVHIGLPGEITDALEWLEQLGAADSVVLVPGNHDCYRPNALPHIEAEWQPYLRGSDRSSRGFPSVSTSGDVTVIGLSSACPTAAFSARGMVGETQLARLDEVLTTHGDNFKCMLIHHPPLRGQIRARKALADAGQLQAIIKRHGIELVLHGHLHYNAETLFNGRTRIIGTASASNNARHRRASYRVFDVSKSNRRWRVRAVLKILDDADTMIVKDDVVWQFD